MSLPAQLIEITDANRHAIEAMPQMRDLLHGRVSRQRCISFLFHIFPIASHFCPLMARALSRSAGRYDRLRGYLHDQLQQQRGHESLVIDDLTKLLVDTTSVQAAPTSAPVQVLLGYNYHAIDEINPHAVLGLIYVLEIMSSIYGGQIAQSMSRSLGESLSQGCGFFVPHAAQDEHSMNELRGLIQSIQQPDLAAIVVNSARNNFYLMREVLACSGAA